MITPDLVSYVMAERAKSTPDQVIKGNLIANGWNEQDIAEALSSNRSQALTAPISPSELKKLQRKNWLIIFSVLIALDSALILFLGKNDPFGISPVSLLARLIVIFIASYLAAQATSPEQNKVKMVSLAIGRIIAAIFVAILVVFGLFFAYCLFMASGFGR